MTPETAIAIKFVALLMSIAMLPRLIGAVSGKGPSCNSFFVLFWAVAVTIFVWLQFIQPA